ncbi:hypothetical protein [Paracoccus luteus]|uniref:hypothetical protein n=1 Tax=Paracoccus luteus TaxID=2508543 RepID=UPI00106FCF8D|nr:hypothetical protein [Paracoccus luteus]
MTTQTLAAHDDYLITLHPFAERQGGPLVITFGAQPSKRTEQGFGTSYCGLNRWDHIFVAQRAGTQIPGAFA